MSDRLDDLLAQMASAAADRDLSQIEPKVWRRIAAAGPAMPLPGWRLPALSTLVALLVGVAASTATATPGATEIAAFSPSIALAPSTLLEATR